MKKLGKRVDITASHASSLGAWDGYVGMDTNFAEWIAMAGLVDGLEHADKAPTLVEQ